MTTAAALPRILVCGGRDFTDKDLLFRTLDRICHARDWTTPPNQHGNRLPMVDIVHGDARGADRLAAQWAAVNWCRCTAYPAQWNRNGRAAGPIRNQRMLHEEHPHLVVAFPGGRGTADMIKRAETAGVETIVIYRD